MDEDRNGEDSVSSVVHSGWILKQGGKRKNWKKRYVILAKPPTCSMKDANLCYFSSVSASDRYCNPAKYAVHASFYEKVRESSLKGIVGLKNTVMQMKRSPNGEPLIMIYSPKRIFRFRGLSEDEANEWMSVMDQVREDAEIWRPHVRGWERKRDKLFTCKLDAFEREMGWKTCLCIFTPMFLIGVESEDENLPLFHVMYEDAELDVDQQFESFVFRCNDTMEDRLVTYVFNAPKDKSSESEESVRHVVEEVRSVLSFFKEMQEGIVKSKKEAELDWMQKMMEEAENARETSDDGYDEEEVEDNDSMDDEGGESGGEKKKRRGKRGKKMKDVKESEGYQKKMREIEIRHAIERLRDGHAFLKHGRKGKPHRRIVRYQEDTGLLSWGKNPQSLSADSYIRDIDILSVSKGMSSGVLKKSGKPEKEDLYFVVSGVDRTLDLESRTPEECTEWVKNFELLLEYLKQKQK
eukprot:TRINITY_DN3568_c0_g1_i1.p1 TRINITY_DN3568_c0_g1~~TRINITY_DN3568_c0_g1_i1.p1  ORF type:complete len:495 (-),score=173.46 TRINITY_DN3568_c0_g1_i1:154-1551(-)